MSGVLAVPLVDMEHVCATRGEDVVLQDVSLRIAAGEHLVLLGPNGCGKSTLLKVMTCELYPLPKPETRVRLFGRERWDTTELRRRLGVVSAELPGKPMPDHDGLRCSADGVLFEFDLVAKPDSNARDAGAGGADLRPGRGGGTAG